MRNLKGVGVALAIIGGWSISLVGLLTWGLEGVPVIFWVPAIAVQTFLHTGLFITAHDAMHGSVAPSHPRVNDVLGGVAVGLYALFSYKKLVRKHRAHHDHPVRSEDPDFHDEGRDRFWPWYVGFIQEYVGAGQLVGMAVVFNIVHHGLGVGVGALNVFWVLPALLSTLQLFTFGTYLPHREPLDGFDDTHRASSNPYPPWLSLLTCYHFGYHHEHHLHPHEPWWRLPDVRDRGTD